ncbi:MAG: hypothetical protein ABFD62_15420, partial [Syntrophaceae bacterium]
MRRHTILLAILTLLLIPAIAVAWKVEGPGTGGGTGSVSPSGSFTAGHILKANNTDGSEFG